MPRSYTPYICQTLGEFYDKLGWMMLSSPAFIDKRGQYPDQNIDTVFKGFNASIDNLRAKLGEDRYAAMREMSDRMRAHFEADPEDKTENGLAGRRIIHEMDLLIRRKRVSGPSPNPLP